MSETDDFVAAVEAATGRPGRKIGRETRLLCPAHDDHDPSLDVAEGGDGRPLVICRSRGCSWQSICEAVGWEQGRGARSNQDLWTPHGDAVAVYDYVDGDGQLLFQVCRTAEKKFSQRRPDATSKSGWRFNLTSVRRVLYRLPEVLAAAGAGSMVFVCEGEKDADAVRATGVTATCNPGGAGKWQRAYTAALRGATVVVIADDDPPGRAHAARVVGDLAAAGVSASAVLPASGKDAADHLSAGLGLDSFVELDAAVKAPGAATEALAADDEHAAPAEPVEGNGLLTDLAALFRRFLVVGEHEFVVLALWVVHTHAIDAADITPYLAITSAEKRSGKTKLLELLSHLTRRPWLTGRVTGSVLARKIDTEHPTLLLDEADAMFGKNSEHGETARAILNTGFLRDGTSSLNQPIGKSGWEPIDLSTFCPKAIAGIGSLPDTVMDRSIKIEMQRKPRTDQVERLRSRLIGDICRPLRVAAAAWASQHIDALTGAQPPLPDELDDRAQDVWEPLLAIADRISGDWPAVARAAAIELSGGREDDDLSIGVRLLRDIRRVFDANEPTDRLPSSTVLTELAQFDDAPWGDWFGKTITSQGISRILKPYKITTREIWFNNEKHRGWMRSQFTDAWQRYLPKVVGPVDAVDDAAGQDGAPTGSTAPTGSPGQAERVCFYDAHQESGWRNDAGRLICGICHPRPDKAARSEDASSPATSESSGSTGQLSL
jgi:hypothetical protein